MLKVKDYLKDKGVGFYFSAAVILLSLLTAIIHVATYAGSDYISWAAFAFSLVSALAGIVLIALGQARFVPIVLAVLALWAMLFFVYAIYYYLSVVAVGIDLDSVDARFVINTILFVLTFGLAVASVFLKQTKEEA